MDREPFARIVCEKGSFFLEIDGVTISEFGTKKFGDSFCLHINAAHDAAVKEAVEEFRERVITEILNGKQILKSHGIVLHDRIDLFRKLADAVASLPGEQDK